MRSQRAGIWLFAGWLLSATSLSGASADTLAGIAPPDPPAALILGDAAPARSRDAAEDGTAVGPGLAAIDLPAPPAVVVSLPGAGEAPSAPEPFAAASVAATEPSTAAGPVASGPPASPWPDLPPAAPLVVTQADLLPAAIELRLRDPKLPLPPRLSRRDREAIAAFYAERDHRPLWVEGGDWSRAASALVVRLEHADEDGLDPAEYPIPGFGPSRKPLAAADLAEAELKLSAAAYLYARDARGGRLDPARISALITPTMDIPGPGAVLATLAASPEPGDALQGYNPAYAGYRHLKAKLAEIRANRPAGPTARLTGRSGIVAQAVADLGAEGRAASRIPAPSSASLEGDLVANMERWRWLAADVPARSIDVNVPEFRLRLTENGRVSHEARVITGRPATPTPIFSGTMEYAIVNPSWFIPPSIMRNEILPGLAKDPNYAAKRGYQVVRRGKSISVRQPPGNRNALGYIKFMFPNDHAVYLHDTPSRHLFASGSRAFSHGCVRVQNPFELGGLILGGTWTEARLKKLIGSGERTIFLREKLPVNLTYFTVSVDEAGNVHSFDDVYGYNRRVRVALGLGA